MLSVLAQLVPSHTLHVQTLMRISAISALQKSQTLRKVVPVCRVPNGDIAARMLTGSGPTTCDSPVYLNRTGLGAWKPRCTCINLLYFISFASGTKRSRHSSCLEGRAEMTQRRLLKSATCLVPIPAAFKPPERLIPAPFLFDPSFLAMMAMPLFDAEARGHSLRSISAQW